MPNIGIVGLRENNKALFRKLIPTWDGATVWSLRDAVIQLFEGKPYKDRIKITIYMGTYVLGASGEKSSSDHPLLWVTCTEKNPLGEIMETLHNSTYFRVRGNYIDKSLAPRALPSD